MTKKREHKILVKDIVLPALISMFIKSNPKHMIKNPIMFVVEIAMFITLIATIYPSILNSTAPRSFNFIITVILFITVLFANFAESIVEGRGKAQANELKKMLSTTKAKRYVTNIAFEIVDAKQLKKGDKILVSRGDIIPMDGEIYEGIATIDESAITGESRPIVKEAGSDNSSVTGGTKVVSDEIKIEINVDPGESFLDKMITLVEGSKRQKTPNEQALNIILFGLTFIFFIVILTFLPITNNLGISVSITTLVALFVCLIPTTIGALLPAIGIAGMNRVTEFNVIAMSGKAVELCGDVTTIIMDKTGTITYGNRMCYDVLAVNNYNKEDLNYNVALASILDDTPEGKSIVRKLNVDVEDSSLKNSEYIKFSAATKKSGIKLANGDVIYKGSLKAMSKFVTYNGGVIPSELETITTKISNSAGTPLVVVKNNEVIGVIHLKDTLKEGLVSRMDELHEMGIKTIMCTGDNELTAREIAREANIDEYIAESSPMDKIEVIKREQAMGQIVAMTGDGTNDAPALAIADIGIAMSSGTTAAKEAANMVDLDSDPTKIIDIVDIGKELLITRGALTTFSIANDIAKYFAVIPAILVTQIPAIEALNIMHLSSAYSAIISAVLFNAIIIPLLIPVAMKGVKYRVMSSKRLLTRNLLIFGLGGIIAPFVGIKLIDMLITPILTILGLV